MRTNIPNEVRVNPITHPAL